MHIYWIYANWISIFDSATTHKILKIGRREIGLKPIFLYICPELAAYISDSIIVGQSKCWIDIFYSLETMCLSESLKFRNFSAVLLS